MSLSIISPRPWVQTSQQILKIPHSADWGKGIPIFTTDALIWFCSTFLKQDCIFQKKHMDTSLRVFYSGVLQTHNCKACCKRWFFTFNGAECSGPLPIEGVIHISSIAQSKGGPLRVRHIEGYCQNIPKGGVRVGINVGNCAGYGNADARSGWNSVSRIVVEEVPAPQQ